MKRIFVSYSPGDLEIVEQLAEDLRARGHNVWYDQTRTGGQRWWDHILAGIRDCDIFIFALSPESLDSEVCRSALDYTLQLGKQILPIVVSEGVNLNLLPPPLNEIQIIDYRGRDKTAFFPLSMSIVMGPDSAPLPNPLPAPPPVPVESVTEEEIDSTLSGLKKKIDSTELLSYRTQLWLVAELEKELESGGSSSEVRELMLKLKARDELLATVVTKIDSALEKFNENVSAQEPQAPAELDRQDVLDVNAEEEEGLAHDVFISYSSKDKEAADAVCTKLESEGIKCWIAPRDIPPSARYAQTITGALEESLLMILIFSSNSNVSRHIESEINIAFDNNKSILPFRIENTPLSSGLLYYLSSAQWFDATAPPLDNHLQRLLTDVRRVLKKMKTQ